MSAASSKPSGLSARRIWASAPGKSFTNCNASAETTRSSEPSANGKASSSAATARPLSRRVCAEAAITVPTLPLAASTLRNAPAGVPRSTARSKRRSTAPSRSPSSPATRSRRNVAGSRAARRWRRRNRRRSNSSGPAMAVPCRAGSRLCYPCSMNELTSARERRSAVGAGPYPRRLARRVAASVGRCAAAALPVLPRAVGRRRRALCAACWSKLSLIEPPYCARLGIPFTYDPGPGLAFDGGDRQSARLRPRARGGTLRRHRPRAGAPLQIRRPARSRAHDGALDGARRARTARRRRRADPGAAALAQTMGAALQPVGRARRRRFRMLAGRAGAARRRSSACARRRSKSASARPSARENVQGAFKVARRARRRSPASGWSWSTTC